MIDSDYVFALEGRVEGLLEQLLEQEAEIIKLKRTNREWEQLWKPIDDLVRPITPLGGCIGDKAVELITSAMKREPAFWYNPTAKNSVISNASKLRKGTAYLYADWSVPLYE